MEFMKLRTWKRDYDLAVEVNRYATNDNLALQLYWLHEGYFEPFAMLTVNFDERCQNGCAFVDTNHFTVAEQLIRCYRLGKPTGRRIRSDYAEYPEYRFDRQAIGKYEVSEKDLRYPVLECRDIGR